MTHGSAPSNSVTIDANTNRITGSPYAYDANGNMTKDGLNTLAYDAENRVLSSSGSQSGTYVYDGASLRVKKCLPNCTSPTTTTVYVFSGAKVIAEYVNGAAVGTPTREYVYSGGALVATHESGSLKFHYRDHLSTRVTSDSAGANRTEQAHYPFGEQWYNSSGSKLLFTSYERDAESGNDYAMMRFHLNRLGRFSSRDQLLGSSSNPQSQNLYAYVLNDPINFVDPTGRWPFYVHERVHQAVLSGILTPSQIAYVNTISFLADFGPGAQRPENSYAHGMCEGGGMDLSVCSSMISTYILSNAEQAQQLSAGGSVMSPEALYFFVLALHALVDSPSPAHSSPDGTPFAWDNSRIGAMWHFLDEQSELVGISQYGQAIRNAVALTAHAFPELLNPGHVDATARDIIEREMGRIFQLMMVDGNFDSVRYESMRGCMLGNPAACIPHVSNPGFDDRRKVTF